MEFLNSVCSPFFPPVVFETLRRCVLGINIAGGNRSPFMSQRRPQEEEGLSPFSVWACMRVTGAQPQFSAKPLVSHPE